MVNDALKSPNAVQVQQELNEYFRENQAVRRALSRHQEAMNTDEARSNVSSTLSNIAQSVSEGDTASVSNIRDGR